MWTYFKSPCVGALRRKYLLTVEQLSWEKKQKPLWELGKYNWPIVAGTTGADLHEAPFWKLRLLLFFKFKNFFYQCCELVDPIPNTLNLDPDPEFWPNLDPDPGPGPDPDPGYVINFEIRDRWTIKWPIKFQDDHNFTRSGKTLFSLWPG